MRRFKRQTNSPKRLWCFLGELVAALRGYTAHKSSKLLQGRCATEHALGYTPGILSWVQHSWYDDVWYRDSDGENKIGKWLGPDTGIGGGDCYWILPTSSQPIARSMVWSITDEEHTVEAIKDSIKALNLAITERIGDQLNDEGVAAGLGGELPPNGDDYFDDDDNDVIEEESVRPEQDDYTHEAFDGYLTASVMLPRGREVLKAQVVARKRDVNGNPIGRANSNPFLDTRVYEVELEDGEREYYSANLIAENMYSQIDTEGNKYLLLSEIIDHAKDRRAMSKDNGTYVDKHGKPRPRITTQGWQLLVEWKDGTSSWVSLKDVKELSPIEAAEYAVANKISEEPAFKWWVEETLRKRHRIINKVNLQSTGSGLTNTEFDRRIRLRKRCKSMKRPGPILGGNRSKRRCGM
jgi:hypothetical protein